MAVYDAFISYSHAKDKPVAAVLQSVVQTLGKPWYRRRALRVFRDDTSLSATPSLWPSIEQALAQSRYLILMASPEAAASHWVNKEIAYWLDHKSTETLLIALTDGDLAWDAAAGDFMKRETLPLPPALSGRFPSEPKWIDLRAYRHGANPRDSHFVEAGADFAAAIHGMPKEDLLSQEVRQQRRALRLAWSAAGSLLLLAGLAGWQWKVAIDNERAAVRNFAIARQAGEDVVFKLSKGLRQVQGMRVESIRQILGTAQELMDGLLKTSPDDRILQRTRATMLNEFTETYLAAGDIESARTAAEESLQIARKLAVNTDGRVVQPRDIIVSLIRSGSVRFAAGDLAGALGAFEEALERSRKLAAASPNDEQLQRDISVYLERVGDTQRAVGNQSAALAAFEECVAIRRKLVAIKPDEAERQSDMHACIDRIGDMRLAAGDRVGAATAYDEGLVIMRKLSTVGPGNVSWQTSLSVALLKVGDVRLASGERAAAAAVFDESLAIMRRLAGFDPGNTSHQRNMSFILTRIGDGRLADGNHAGALAAYDEGLAIIRKLVAASPGNLPWQLDITYTLDKIADTRVAAGDRAAALAAAQEALAITRKLAVSHSDNAQLRPEVARRLIKVGDIQYAAGDRTAALTAYEENLAIRRKLVAAEASNVRWQLDLVLGLFKVASVVDTPRVRLALREAIAILENLERENKLPVAQRTWLERLRGALAKLPPEQAKTR